MQPEGKVFTTDDSIVFLYIKIPLLGMGSWSCSHGKLIHEEDSIRTFSWLLSLIPVSFLCMNWKPCLIIFCAVICFYLKMLPKGTCFINMDSLIWKIQLTTSMRLPQSISARLIVNFWLDNIAFCFHLDNSSDLQRITWALIFRFDEVFL